MKESNIMTVEELSVRVFKLEEERKKEKESEIEKLKSQIESLKQENTFYKALIDLTNSIHTYPPAFTSPFMSPPLQYLPRTEEIK